MKILTFTLIFFIVQFSNSKQAYAVSSKNFIPPHIPLQLSLEESQKRMRNYWFEIAKGELKSKSPLTPTVELTIEGGEKLSLWIKKINSNRNINDPIRLSSSSSRHGIPISKPSKYSPQTITEKLNRLLEELPLQIKEIVYNDQPITNKIPTNISKEIFITSAKEINRLYQTSVRWTTVIEPWLSWYSSNQRKDIRGYYNLNKIIDLDQKLINFKSLDEDLKLKLKSNLINICQNSSLSNSFCDKKLKKSLQKNNLLKYKNKYIKFSETVWNSYFKITDPRTDVIWTKQNPSLMIIPFKEPSLLKVSSWLKENVEDEFSNDLWNLEINYNSNSRSWNTAELKFTPGVTPSVRGGNTIIMDKNTPLEEYEVKWTIRHEFGHILRLPDCYVEFYDKKKKLAINYQLDISNLMCSRAGDFHQDNFNELKRVYFNK